MSNPSSAARLRESTSAAVDLGGLVVNGDGITVCLAFSEAVTACAEANIRLTGHSKAEAYAAVVSLAESVAHQWAFGPTREVVRP